MAPMAKATMVEWLRVKKYLRPGSSPAHSSRSESCANPAALSRRFASSIPDGSSSRKESVSSDQSARGVEGKKEEGRRKKERQTGVVPTAWKAVGDALRKSTRSETTGATAAIGGGGGSRRGDGSAEAGRSVWTARKTEARNDEAQERNQLARPREGVFFSLFV